MLLTLGSIVMNPDVADANGCYWLVQEMTGWESPPSRLDYVEFTSKHGSAAVNPTYGPRALTLTGVTKAPSEAAFWVAYNQFLGVLNTGITPITFTVNEGGTDKSLGVIRAMDPKVQIKPGHFTWQIGLTAPDPIKYGAAVTSTIGAGATVGLSNTGNIASYNILTTATSAARLILTNSTTGQLMTSVAALTSGTVLNHLRRTVYSGGVNRYIQMDPLNQWWPLNPGVNSIVSGGGSAGVSVTYRPAWA